MFCTSCGAQVNDKAVVCPSCGCSVVKNVQVPNHMVGAILTTIFCCLIGGIVAIVYASQVNTKLAQGDIEGAKAASKSAQNWITASVAIGALIAALYVVSVFIGAMAS